MSRPLNARERLSRPLNARERWGTPDYVPYELRVAWVVPISEVPEGMHFIPLPRCDGYVMITARPTAEELQQVAQPVH